MTDSPMACSIGNISTEISRAIGLLYKIWLYANIKIMKTCIIASLILT